MNLAIQQQYRLAVLCLLFASAMWGFIWYPMRLFEQHGLSVVWVTLLMYLTAGFFGLFFIRRNTFVWKALTMDLIWLALAAGVTNLAFLVALIEGEVVRVMLLFYLSPLWSVLIGRWWLAEHLTTTAMVMLLIAMSGTVMMLWQPEIGLPWPHGRADWLALFAGVMFSINNVLSRKLAAVSMMVKTTFVFWGVVLVSIVVLLIRATPVPEVSIDLWLLAMGLGGAMIIAMTVTVLYGLAKMPVYRSAVIMLFELIVAAVSAWWLTEEMMTLPEWFGGALIFVAAYGIAYVEKNR